MDDHEASGPAAVTVVSHSCTLSCGEHCSCVLGLELHEGGRHNVSRDWTATVSWTVLVVRSSWVNSPRDKGRKGCWYDNVLSVSQRLCVCWGSGVKVLTSWGLPPTWKVWVAQQPAFGALCHYPRPHSEVSFPIKTQHPAPCHFHVRVISFRSGWHITAVYKKG